MKSCEECQSLIDLYLDDGLTRDEKQRFLSHISSCNECSEALDFAKSVKSTLANLPELEIPSDFTIKVREKLNADRVKKKGFGTYAIRYGSLAACLVLAVAIAQGVDTPDFSKKSEDANDYVIQKAIPKSDEAYTFEQNAGEEVSTPTNEKIAATPAPNTQTPKPRTKDKTDVQETTQSPIPTPQLSNEAVVTSDTVIADPALYSADVELKNDIATASISEEQTNTSTEATTDNTSALSQATDNYTEPRVSGGGGGGSSSARAIVAPITLSVAVDSLDTARIIVTEHSKAVDGIYNTNKTSFDTILEEFTKQGIDFNITGEISEENITFILTIN